MTTFLHRGWLLLAACIALLLQPLGEARAQSTAAFGPLVSAAWLQQNLPRGELLLLDTTMSHQYAAKHIPGAVNVDLYSYGLRDPGAAEFERLLQRWGVSPGRKIVLYDAGGDYSAARIYWDFLRAGIPAADMAVLDGGLAAWQAAGGAVTKDPTPAPAPGTIRVARVFDDVRSYGPEFLAASGEPARHAVVEALQPSYYFGETKFFHRAGHVPNAIMWSTETLFNADKTFKSRDELRRMAEYLGIRQDQTVHSYCGGGVAAAGPWFALKVLLGYPSVKLYRGSLLEWQQDERGLPLWTYSAPALMRDMQWVNAWTNKMMRIFSVTRQSVIDVRPEAAYALGHVPYALSIPAERFRAGLADPASLAAALGPAGVDPAHEAVIVSEGGLNPRAALAFLTLEKLGQKQVSIMMESVDEWGLRGLPLTRDATVIGTRPTPMDPLIAKANYTATPRAGVAVRDAMAIKGLYPKVFVAAGKAPPAKAPEGKLVHVPYTELLAADGTPKPAKDLWTLLSKAGVPRYAELVVVADDPGEAAVAYVVLKMMGWPDVKVLVN